MVNRDPLEHSSSSRGSEDHLVSPATSLTPSPLQSIPADDPFAGLPDAIEPSVQEEYSEALGSLGDLSDLTTDIPQLSIASSPSTPTADVVIATMVSDGQAKKSLIQESSLHPQVGSKVVGKMTSESVPHATAMAATVPTANEETAAGDPLLQPRRRKTWLQEAPSWLVSLVTHVAVIMILAAFQMEPVRNAIGILTSMPGDAEVDGLQEFDIQGADLDTASAAEASELTEPSSVSIEQSVELPELSSVTSLTVASDSGALSNIVESIAPSSSISSNASRLASSLSSRGGAMKGEMLEKYGGNAASEKSVALALKWIAGHQSQRGNWSFGHSLECRGQCKEDGDLVNAHNAATALALLPFLGAGQTHVEGKYKDTVKKGLAFLIRNMKLNSSNQTGSWHEPGGSMYSHGLASIAVCEAYAMTRDPDLLQPAQLALNFIVDAQHPQGGGWRYNPKQPGDTSVVGWQLMAMKSGVMGNLLVPNETFRKANSFLDSISVNNGAYYGYDRPTSSIESRQATTAIGLLCRMYLGWPKDHPGLKEGVAFISKKGPNTQDLYYSYYATQVLRQHGGPEWERWNLAMRDGLIKAQESEGHAAGSWFSGRGHNLKGGRLYCTAMSTMILEVYYRHMPIYSSKSSDDDFQF